MPLSLTEEHADLAASVTEFAERFAGILETREQLDSYRAGGRPAHWGELVDNGLHALHINEERGGQGGSVADTAIVVEEFGRRLVPGPYVATVLASAAVAGAAECKASIRGLDLFAAGATGSLVTPAAGISAGATAQGWVLNGTANVASLISAEYLVIGFAVDSVTRFALVDADAAGVQRIAEPCTDLTRDAGVLVLDGLVIDDAAILDDLSESHVNTLRAGLLAAEAAGIMRWAVEESTDYAKLRKQFGVPIGSFQAIKHKCANLLISAELATAAAWSALVSLEQDSVQQTLAAGSAIEAAIAPSVEAVTEAITIFGGIGFTWEHDAHLYWRRAITLVAQISSQIDTATLGRAALDHDRRIDIELPDEDPSFRERIATLLDEAITLENEHDGGRWYSRGTQRTFLAENGLAAPHWSAPYGLDASPAEQVVISQEYARRELIQPSSVIGEWAMPTILAYGSDAIREQFALPTLRGELIWCQLFSEPDAGSDLAGLSTRATKVAGGWELKGQKVWTSGAHEADWGICLARTDTEVPKHKGLSYFLVDMRSAGIDVRPLKQPTGESEFNEVFLDSVFVPDDYLLGEPGQGWRITATTLQNERTQISSGVSAGTESSLRAVIRDGGCVAREQEAFTSLGRIAAFSSAIGALNLRETLRQVNGLQPGVGSSLAKVAHARLNREAATHVLRLAGPASLFADAPGDAVTAQLSVPQVLIGGGTVEVQLNVIAERLLGLPRS